MWLWKEGRTFDQRSGGVKTNGELLYAYGDARSAQAVSMRRISKSWKVRYWIVADYESGRPIYSIITHYNVL